MMRKLVMVLLALGTIVGFGSGMARWHHERRHGRDRFMDRVAEECVQAARRVDRRAEGGPDRRAERPESR